MSKNMCRKVLHDSVLSSLYNFKEMNDNTSKHLNDYKQ